MKSLCILLAVLCVSCASVKQKGFFVVSGDDMKLHQVRMPIVTEWTIEYGACNVVRDDDMIIWNHFYPTDTKNELLYTPTWKIEKGQLYIGVQYHNMWREAYALSRLPIDGPYAMNFAIKTVWWPAEELAIELVNGKK